MISSHSYPDFLSSNDEHYFLPQLINLIHFYYFSTACLASRPGQVGRADGYILEGKELEFYLRKIKAKKGK